MPLLYRTGIASEADLKVYLTDSRSEADLIVFESFDAWAAVEPWIWVYTDLKAEADKIVHFTEFQWEADITIYKTEIQPDGGWVDEAKQALL
ncbi:MAG: DUF6150 family protein [Anaerolineae bacterium]|jgi:hypothetical protein